MDQDSRARPARKGDLLRLVAEALAPHLRDLLQPAAPNAPLYYSQRDSPLGRRRHLELARNGAIPRKKVGRLILSPREAVHAFIDAHAPRAATSEVSDDVLEDWGLRSRARR